MCVDVVESVRLIEAEEDYAVDRWRKTVDHVVKHVLPPNEGRLIKSLGDGMLLEFARVAPAVNAAFAIQRACHAANDGIADARKIVVRIGAHVAELIADELDVYGHGVNVAARLTTLAGPGEIVVSAPVRDQLTAMLDADIEDLGECYLKHLRQPVRAYRIGPPGERPVIEPGTGVRTSLQPSIAVIPFLARGNDPEHEVLGEILADEIIGALSRSSDIDVISRLSTTALRARSTTLAEASALLHANYILSGAYRVHAPTYTLTVELAEARSGKVAWSQTLRGNVDGVLGGADEVIDRVVAEVAGAVMVRELQRAQTQALPTLESYTLLIGAIALMHRMSSHDFDRARQMLEALTERAPRLAVPQAWLAKWHVLRVQQGWTDDAQVDARRALERSKRALDDDPHCSLALAIDGFVHTNLLKRLDVAEERYKLALLVNPNDSLAWLLKGTMHAFKGEATAAVESTARARRLSPLDPLRYFYDSLSATAALAAEDFARAAELAQSSYRLNRRHASTLRALIISQWQLGNTEEARRKVAELLEIEPHFSVTKFVERSPSTGYATGKLWADTLRLAGVPE